MTRAGVTCWLRTDLQKTEDIGIVAPFGHVDDWYPLSGHHRPALSKGTTAVYTLPSPQRNDCIFTTKTGQGKAQSPMLYAACFTGLGVQGDSQVDPSGFRYGSALTNNFS